MVLNPLIATATLRSPELLTFSVFAAFDQSKPISSFTSFSPLTAADRLPAHLLKEVLISVGSDILALINTCLSSGCFPTAFKHPIEHPLIKNPNLDDSSRSYFRPISKLPFYLRCWRKYFLISSFFFKLSTKFTFLSGYRTCTDKGL